MLARSGQGLIGQSEELDQLLAKVFKEEMMEGRMARIQDDIVIGGIDQEEAFATYKSVIEKPIQNAADRHSCNGTNPGATRRFY